MPLAVPPPDILALSRPELLNQDAFSAFGSVIENPSPSLLPNSHIELPPNALLANQGSALKYLDVSKMRNLYGSAPSKRSGRAVMNMFVCAPRSLLPSSESNVEGHFPVVILERHPYTTQTFIPLGLSPKEAKDARYLVIVAPTLPPCPADEHFPVPNGEGIPGSGLPDLSKARSFIAEGSQAVTYDAGTWHAPMVVAGKKPISFVVVQFVSGVAIEDCQEVEWVAEQDRGFVVAVPKEICGSRESRL